MGGLLSVGNALISGEVDFCGQELAYQLHAWIIWCSTAVGFLIGLYYQRFLYTFYAIAAATLVAAIVCIPSWPQYARNLVEWAEPRPPASSESDEDASTKKEPKEEDSNVDETKMKGGKKGSGGKKAAGKKGR